MKGLLTTTGASLSGMSGRSWSGRALDAQIPLVPGAAPGASIPRPDTEHRVVLVDLGVKYGILRELVRRGCDVVVVPHDTSGRGDRPAPAPTACSCPTDPETPRMFRGRNAMRWPSCWADIALFGICLGPPGARPGLRRRHGENEIRPSGGQSSGEGPAERPNRITSQNHGYAVKKESAGSDRPSEITHISLNDGTVEGLRHRKLPAFFRPVPSGGGPRSPGFRNLFDRFLELMDRPSRRKEETDA